MVVPQEVPLGPRDFVNRKDDLDRMDEFWDARSPGAPLIGVCSGIPGVGKTAFVRQWVQRCRESKVFPGGDLHVEFAAADGAVSSVADALASCLGALGVAKDVIPEASTERANHLRSLTASRQVLIVLEDVTDSAQVLPFMPNGEHSALVVTSSARLTDLLVDGAESIQLAPLDADAGAHLLTVLVGARAEAEPAAVGRLVDQCGGLPVALKVSAAQLRARKNLRVSDLAEQIEAGRAGFSVGGKDRLAPVFKVASDVLEVVPLRVFRLLGIFPGRDLTSETASAFVDVDPESLNSALETLIESGLVDEDSENRISLHAMVRRHARQLAYQGDTADDRETALRRVVGYFVSKAEHADLAVLGTGRYRIDPGVSRDARAQPFVDKDAALAWMERERANLLAVQREAMDLQMYDAVWRLAEAFSALYVTRRYLVDWIETSDLGARAARLAGNARAEARLRSFMSRALTDQGDLVRAQRELADAVPMAEAADDTRLLGSVWEMQGRYLDYVDPVAAVDAFQRAIALFTQEGDARGAAFTLFFLGCSHHKVGKLQLAENILGNALTQISDLADNRMRGRCLNELGAVVRAQGKVEPARELLQEAVSVLAADKVAYYEAVARENLLSTLQEDEEEMKKCLRALVALHQSMGTLRADEFANRLRKLGESVDI